MIKKEAINKGLLRDFQISREGGLMDKFQESLMDKPSIESDCCPFVEDAQTRNTTLSRARLVVKRGLQLAFAVLVTPLVAMAYSIIISCIYVGEMAGNICGQKIL